MHGKSAPISNEFLAGGGEMGALTRAHDWSATALGAPETWPQSLKTTVRLLLTSQHPMFIWWGQDLIQFYNDAYRQTMGPERHPSALGQPGRECWQEIWHIIGPQIEYVMAGQGATWNEQQLVPVTRHGSREEVWWTYGYSPIDDESGVGGVLVICKDVTEEVRAREVLKAERERLRELFQKAPGFMCVLHGPNHVFEIVNDSYLQLIGHRRDVIGKSAREALPEIEGQGFFQLLDTVFLTGEPFVGRSMPVSLQREPGSPVEERFIDLVYQPITDAHGKVTGLFAEGYDVTERVHAEAALRESAERHRLILNSATDYAIIANDMVGRVTSWSEGARRVLGWTEDEVLGEPTDRFFTPEDVAAGEPQKERQAALHQGRAIDERWHQRKSGKRFWASGELTPLKDDAGKVTAS